MTSNWCLNYSLSIDETKSTILIFWRINIHNKRKHMLTFHGAIIPLNSIIEYIPLHCLCVIHFLIFTGKNMRKECFPCGYCKQLLFSSYSFIKANFTSVVLLITTWFQCSCLIDRKLLEWSLQYANVPRYRYGRMF